MAKTLHCGDIIPGCPEVVRAETEEEIVRAAAAHVASVHGIPNIDEPTLEKVKAAIRES